MRKNAAQPIAYTWALTKLLEKGGNGVVRIRKVHRWTSGAAWILGGAGCAALAQAPATAIAPTAMPRVGAVDERFQSYNIEAAEITGGTFWKPYAAASAPEANPKSATAASGVMNPSLYQFRPPIDLYNPRLRKLAAALAPAYVRVSGTWMNSTTFQDSDGPAPAQPPAGFNSVLTRAEWKGVIDFARAVDARIVTSFAISAGTRDSAGVWTPQVAQALIAYTKAAGGSIAGAEFMNEPTFPEAGGAPKDYDATAYARDFAVFHTWVKENAPGMQILGPGGIFEGTPLAPPFMHLLKSEDILKATAPVFDIFSYHSYGTVSSRCAASLPGMGTTEDAALSGEWLARSAAAETYYVRLRDRYEPGRPMWNTETAQAACGGDRWASTFIDTFRYLNQLGGLARLGVQVQIHNTLNASDYGLLDEDTLKPRPDYWAALLWHKLMGATVLDPSRGDCCGAGLSASSNLHVYAHCLRNQPGGVAVLAINADKESPQSLRIPAGAERYTLTASSLTAPTVDLNGEPLKLGADDALPDLRGAAVRAKSVTLAPVSITFLVFPKAENAACK